MFYIKDTGGLYYNPMMIVNDDSRVVTKLETSLADDARVIIYNRHMFIAQATDWRKKSVLLKIAFLLRPIFFSKCYLNFWLIECLAKIYFLIGEQQQQQQRRNDI